MNEFVFRRSKNLFRRILSFLLLSGIILFPAHKVCGATLKEMIYDGLSKQICTCPKNRCPGRIGVGSGSSPDLNTWMARVLTEGFEGDGKGTDYQNLTSLQRAEYLLLGEKMNEDPGTLLSSASWMALENGLSVNVKTIYEALIIEYLSFDLYDTETTNPFDGSAVNNLLVTLYDLDNDLITNSLRDTGLLDSSVMTAKNPHPKTKADGTLEKTDAASFALSQISLVEGALVKPVMDTMVNTALIANAADERIYFLDCIRAGTLASEKPDMELAGAIDEVLTCYYQTAEKYFWEQGTNAVKDTIWNETLEYLSKANPVFKAVKTARDTADVFFGNRSRAESNIRLAAIYSLGLHADTALKNAHSVYLPYCSQNSSAETAAAKGFVSCYYGYLEFQLFANNIARQWVDTATNLSVPIIGEMGIKIKFNKKDAEASIGACDAQNRNYKAYLSFLAKKTGLYFRLFAEDCECGCQKLPAPDQDDVPASSSGDDEDVTENGYYGYGIYDGYIAVLLDIAKEMDEYEKQGIPGQACYALYDLDDEHGDGTPELLVNYGKSFGTMIWHVYCRAEDGMAAYEIGTFDGNRISPYARTDAGMWGVSDSQGMWEVLCSVTKSGSELSVLEISPDGENTDVTEDAQYNGPIGESWFSGGTDELDLDLFSPYI